MSKETVTLVDGYVPVIDLSSRGGEAGRVALADAIGRACETSGFYVVVGHGVPSDLVERMRTVTNAFFRLPDAEKDLVASRPGVSGYRRSGGTTARSLDRSTPPDMCEAFGVHVTGDLPDAERARLGDYPSTWRLANAWPANPPGFTATWREYLAAVTALADDLVRLSARALGLPEEHFADRFGRHVSSLVANYYYPRVHDPLPGQLRRGAHTDFGALTVLYQEHDNGGLQVLRGEDDWRDVRAVPGGLVVNIGDLMALWSGGRWVSTMHRVVNAEPGNTSSRLSIPFFHQPDHDAPAGDVTAGEWMAEKTRKLFAPAD
ncbi:isopenicillin N synthase family dioxygenase [Saccharothrix australiensis]|uniref:Isopenicillin N synthase-like dioxygenase n=1 Tax=Saccharothrix australiensis TaxID=2072 RepID=A0A495W738_9PSEU|nr:2-oxoglutarate and iron-dependent oxygenase domain-containing protein [Saccharothrix australiensis]RKT56453.1 isopenicillin N synthase-like dioxygenase [Saccharothrix australiensis]